MMENLNIDYFKEIAYKYDHLIERNLTILDGLIMFHKCMPHLGSPDLSITYAYLVAQLVSGAQGACFINPEDWNRSDLDGLVGKPVLDIVPSVPDYIKIALLDAFYYHINLVEGLKSSQKYKFSGTVSQKSLARARKLIELSGVTLGSKVAIIGLVVNIARVALEKGAEVKIADLAMAGTEALGLRVEYNAVPLIEWADIALITGNTLKTNTVGQLLDIAIKNSTKVLVYAMTGHHIAPRYLNYGAEIVTSEELPCYSDANHTTNIMEVFRADERQHFPDLSLALRAKWK